MGLTAMIPDMTIGQLTVEATKRWGEIWDAQATRMTILLLCPRSERKIMELHGDMVEHGQPVLTVFHRPREEAHLLEDQGFDTTLASFQFVDIATADLGLWMQHLVSKEGWLRGSIEIAPTPFSVGLPTQRAFEVQQTLYFRHPSLPALRKYFLPFPVDALPGKCFVSLPRRAAAEMARQQAEVLGVGRLEKPVVKKPEPVAPISVAAPIQNEAKAVAPESSPVSVEDAEIATPDAQSVSPPTTSVSVPLPPSSPTAPESSSSSEATAPISVPRPVDSEQAQEAPALVEEERAASVELPAVEEVVSATALMSELEKELRSLFQELIIAGVEPSAFMDDPRFEDLNERAIAEGLEVWPILLEMTTMG